MYHEFAAPPVFSQPINVFSNAARILITGIRRISTHRPRFTCHKHPRDHRAAYFYLGAAVCDGILTVHRFFRPCGQHNASGRIARIFEAANPGSHVDNRPQSVRRALASPLSLITPITPSQWSTPRFDYVFDSIIRTHVRFSDRRPPSITYTAFRLTKTTPHMFDNGSASLRMLALATLFLLPGRRCLFSFEQPRSGPS